VAIKLSSDFVITYSYTNLIDRYCFGLYLRDAVAALIAGRWLSPFLLKEKHQKFKNKKNARPPFCSGLRSHFGC
jgi:hypothetical protein